MLCIQCNMKNNAVHIVFSGGGTAGHLTPGLAVAECLAAALPRVRITFCGVGKPLERQMIGRSGFEYFTLPASPMPRGVGAAVSFVVEQLSSQAAAGRFLREEEVDAVVGLGGYASVPMARAAVRHDLPLVLLEQNAVPGKATRWLAGRASLVCASYEQTRSMLRCRCPVRVTGNPIRRGFAAKSRSMLAPLSMATTSIDLSNIYPSSSLKQPVWNQSQHAKQDPGTATGGRGIAGGQILVLGGSGGARALNENVPPALYKVGRQLRGWRIVHQTGEADLDATRTLYRKLALDAVVAPFFDNLPSLLAGAELAISRAGGSTLAELAAAGVPAVLLPYPHAADDHQAANARHYADGGGCVTIDQRKVAGRLDDELAEKLCFLLADGELRRRMSAAMLDLARPQAAEDAAELVWTIASSRSHGNVSTVQA